MFLLESVILSVEMNFVLTGNLFSSCTENKMIPL